MADPGKGPGGPGSPLFLDQTEARRAEKNFFWDRASPYLRVWMTGPPWSVTVYDFPVHDSALRKKKKTVVHTFLPSFDNANGRLCQVRLLWSRNFATMVTWRHTIVKTFRSWSWREFNTESLFLKVDIVEVEETLSRLQRNLAVLQYIPSRNSNNFWLTGSLTFIRGPFLSGL